MTVIEAAWDLAAKSGTIVYVMCKIFLCSWQPGPEVIIVMARWQRLFTNCFRFFSPHFLVLLDSSSSLLFSLLLAQLPVLTVASPVPHRRPSDMDKLSNQTKILIKLTQELLVSQDFILGLQPLICDGRWPDCLKLCCRCWQGVVKVEEGNEVNAGSRADWLAHPFAAKQLSLNYTKFAPHSVWLSCFH